MKSSLVSQVLLAFLLFVVAGSGFADRVYKTDGTIVEGKIVLLTDDKVVIEASPSLVKIEIPRNKITKVEQGLGNEYPESVRADYAAGEKALKEGRPLDAAGHLLAILDRVQKPPDIVLHDIFTALERASAVADENAAKSVTRLVAIKQYETLQSYITRPGFQKYTTTSPQWKNFPAQIKRKLANVHYVQAVDYTREKNPDLYPRIEQYLVKALALTPETDSHYNQVLEALGFFQMTYLGKYDAAIQAFKMGYVKATDSTVKQHFYDLMTKARDAKVKYARVHAPVIVTPTPLTGEAIARMNPPSPEPLKPPSPRVITKEEIPVGKRLKHLFKNKKYKETAILLWKTVRKSNIPPIILMGIAAFFVLWIVPILIVRWRAHRADLLAAKLLTIVKLTGIVGLVIYLFAALFKAVFQRTSRDRCPFCKKPVDNIEAYIDYNFRICPHCHENIVPIYSLEDYILHLVKTVQAVMNKRAGVAGIPTVLEKDAMLKLIRAIITLAYRRRASDLHVEPEPEGLKIRARIDGMLYEILNLPKQVAEAVVSAIKVMANLDISEKRIPQDGRISIWVDKRDLDLRINTSPAAQGEKVSIRLLDPESILVDSTKLGLEADNLEKFEHAIRKPYGFILVTGPSGCGKSTTLYVALHTINTGDKNVVTIEDPIEYRLEGINQQQVHEAANFTFATGLRSILRQDPDIIMVGEIRDRETAEIAIDAATTGHLVFTTLHTIDAPTAFARLHDLGIPSRRFASVLIAVIAQRLIRLNCPDCKKPYKPKKSDLNVIQINDRMGIVFMKGPGCDTCNNTGFFGRTGLFEIFMPDQEMKKILETNPAVSVIRELARKKGMRTLREEGILRVTRGLTPVEEVLRVTT